MGFLQADTFVIESTASFRKAFARAHYDVTVYDQFDRVLGTVAERKKSKVLGAVRLLSDFDGETPYDLVVRDAAGTPVLRVRKGISALKQNVRVSLPDGPKVGTLRSGLKFIELFDPDDRALGTLGDVAGLERGVLAERNGQKVRRDSLQLRPGAPEPARTLAIAAGLAYPIVVGLGANGI